MPIINMTMTELHMHKTWLQLQVLHQTMPHMASFHFLFTKQIQLLEVSSPDPLSGALPLDFTRGPGGLPQHPGYNGTFQTHEMDVSMVNNRISLSKTSIATIVQKLLILRRVSAPGENRCGYRLKRISHGAYFM